LAILAGLARSGDDPVAERSVAQARALFASLTSAFGEPAARIETESLSAAVFPQHVGDSVVATDGAIGFGEVRCPPWLRCHHDAEKRTTRIEVDRYGFSLVYTRTIGSFVLFCSSARALAALDPKPKRDLSAIAELLAFDHVLGERTLYAGVTAVPQGAELTVSPRGSKLTQRFRYSDIPLHKTTLDAAATDLVTSWKRAIVVALDLQRDGSRITAPLSGGLDSRLLARSAIDAGAELDVFTFARDASCPDAMIAREVARTLGTPWRFLTLDDDWLAAFADRASQLTDGHLDVIHSYGVNLLDGFTPGRLRLDGLAGDVVLGGSFLPIRPPPSSLTSKQRLNALWRSRSRLDAAVWQELMLPEARGALTHLAHASLAESVADAGYNETDPRASDFWVLRHRIRRFTVNGALLWQSVARNVYPFFEPRFVDRLLGVHPDLRRNAALQLRFFQRGYPALARIPWQKTGRPLPEGGLSGVLRRARERLLRKRPAYPPGGSFYSFDEAFKASPRLQAFMRERLLDPSTGLARFGCFDLRAVERLLSDTAAGRQRGMARLGLLLTLTLSE
jgi:asparagine synthetase B (glutamine-hydrolysing)